MIKIIERDKLRKLYSRYDCSPMVLIRAGWASQTPVVCEYLDSQVSPSQFLLCGHWSLPLPYCKKKQKKQTPKKNPRTNQTNIKTH